GAVPVRPDGHHVRAVTGIGARLQQRLQVRATTGDEDDETSGVGHITTVAAPGGGPGLGQWLRPGSGCVRLTWSCADELGWFTAIAVRSRKGSPGCPTLMHRRTRRPARTGAGRITPARMTGP